MSRALMLIAMLAVLANADSVFGQKEDGRQGKPLEQLPEYVPAAEQKLSLFADYDHPRIDGRIPVYLINRTAKAIKLRAQDGDVYLKLECENEDGSWVRAQPQAYSWCGNSYHSCTVLSERFVEIAGYRVAKGDQRTVRYKFYGQKELQLSSNPGPGLVSAHDLHRAANDAMAVKEGIFKLVSGVALGTIVLNNEMDHMTDLQQLAIWKLGSGCFNTSQSRAALQQAKEKFPERKKEIEDALKQLEEVAAKQIET